jgi:hypothetical protein
MAKPEPGRGLLNADVADVDAAADPLCVLEPLGHLDEPARIQASGVLEEDNGATGPLAKARIQLAHPGKQAIGLCPHVMVVMDDKPNDPACEAVSKFPDRGATPLVQHIDAAIQVHHGQARMGGDEAQDILQLLRRIGVHLGRHAHLGETEPSEFQQSIVPGNALLEQGMNGP